MKVLWFTNNPCGAIEKLTGKRVVSGSWLYSLSQHIGNEPNINLHIAFYWNDAIKPFEMDGITYHPIMHKGGKNVFTRLTTRYKRIIGLDEDSKEIECLNQVINQVNPDIIHIHGTEENFGLIYRFKPSCPIVVSIQGIISPILQKFYGDFSKTLVSKNETLFSKISCLGINSIEKLYKIKSKNEIEILKNITNVIGRTFWDKACTEAINPSRRYFEVGEIMRQEFFDNKWCKTSFSKPLKLVSTISGGLYKGLETIYSAANILKNSAFQFEWNVIGIDKSDLITKLSEKEVGKSAEKLNINLLGRKIAPEMVEIMKDSDIFVQVSHIENSPNSLCEAMLLGIPIIATFAGGTASLLKNGEEGILIQDGDPYVMAGMIIELSKNFLIAKEMGSKATLVSFQRHTPEKVIGQLINSYKEILDDCKF